MFIISPKSSLLMAAGFAGLSCLVSPHPANSAVVISNIVQGDFSLGGAVFNGLLGIGTYGVSFKTGTSSLGYRVDEIAYVYHRVDGRAEPDFDLVLYAAGQDSFPTGSPLASTSLVFSDAQDCIPVQPSLQACTYRFNNTTLGSIADKFLDPSSNYSLHFQLNSNSTVQQWSVPTTPYALSGGFELTSNFLGTPGSWSQVGPLYSDGNNRFLAFSLSATEVPGPIPALSLFSAFEFSRKLRNKLRSKRDPISF